MVHPHNRVGNHCLLDRRIELISFTEQKENPIGNARSMISDLEQISKCSFHFVLSS
jgi:hypothetical protein